MLAFARRFLPTPPPRAELDASEYDLCIVGCGISGLACAVEALEYNPDLKICMLEASDRIGGRIRKLDFPVTDPQRPSLTHTIPIDVGAMYMHGFNLHEDDEKETYSVFEDLVRETGIPLDGLQYNEGEDGEDFIYDESKEEIVDVETLKGIGFIYEAAERYSEIYEDDDDEAAVTLSEFLRQFNLEQDEDDRLTPEQLQKVIVLADRIVAKDLCTDADKLLLNHYYAKSEAWEYGETSIYVQGEMFRVVEYFAGLLERENVNIFLNSPVDEIGLTEDEEKTVITTKNDEKFIALQTICSVPLPILQRRVLSFDPPLPRRVMETIESIQVNAACKIVVQLDRPICEPGLILTKHSDTFGELLFEERKVDGDFCAHIAIALCTGSLGEKCDEIDDDELIRLFAEELQGMFKTDLECLGGHVARWTKMPYILGGYSSTPADSRISVEDVEALKEPLWDECLFLCGEGLAWSQSSVQEAIVSGREAAYAAVGPDGFAWLSAKLADWFSDE